MQCGTLGPWNIPEIWSRLSWIAVWTRQISGPLWPLWLMIMNDFRVYSLQELRR